LASGRLFQNIYSFTCGIAGRLAVEIQAEILKSQLAAKRIIPKDYRADF